MIEIHVTHKDGRQMCWKLKPGEKYVMRGDEVSIEVCLVKRDAIA